MTSPPGGATANGDRSDAGGPSWAVVSSRQAYRGRLIGVRVDEVRMPGDRTAVREVIEHPGAVGIVALDDADQVVLIRQYRHASSGYYVELPAGLLDVPGEPAPLAAGRELAEETGLRAVTWHTLVDVRPSPGMTNEAVRVFLARGLTPVPEAERHVGVDEETDLHVHRVALDDAVRGVLAGEIENGIAVAGLLAAARARDAGWSPLRPSDAPWPARPGH